MSNNKAVARLAKVSTATVSRVVNNYPHINEATRKRVLKAMRQLNYQPNRVARRLRMKRTQTIGLIVADITNPYYAEMIQSIEEIAYANQYGMLLCNTNEDPEKEKSYIDLLLNEQVAGIVISPVDEDYELSALHLAHNTPIVAIDRRLNRMAVDTVLVKNEQGAREATEYLVRLGHQRIGLIAGPSRLTTARERRAGYEKALIEHGLKLDKDLIKMGNFKQVSGYEKAVELLTMARPPSAIFVTNNLMTLGALNAIHAKGLKIPDDFSILGFDDLSWAPSLNPPLTTVAQPTYELGRNAAELLFRRITNGNGTPVEINLPPTLIIRDSCRTVASGSIQAISNPLRVV
jgi:DNA-binding LacI/PurR family transcriptional regulator